MCGLVIALAQCSTAQTLTATVVVNATEITKSIDKRLFGANVEWIFAANNLYDVAGGKLNPSLVSMTAQMAPGTLRFPGGVFADYYHWQDGVGPQDQRPWRPHLGTEESGTSANVFGTGELVSLCRASGAEPLIQVNMVSGSAAEAADWVKYCNSATDARRIAHGSSTPYNVRFWELGNEQYHPQGASTASSMLTPDEYVARALSYSAAMKAASSTIKVGAVVTGRLGPCQIGADPLWNRKVLQEGAGSVDFLSVHNGYAPVLWNSGTYSFDDVYRALLAFPVQAERDLAALNQEIDTYAPGHKDRLEVAVTEWGPLFHIDMSHPYVDHSKTLGSGLFVANMLQVFARAPRVSMANFFKLIDWFFLGAMNYEGVPKPSYHVLENFSKSFGPHVLPTHLNTPSYTAKTIGCVEAATAVPYIDAVSSLNADFTTLNLVVVNKHFSANFKTTLLLFGFEPQKTASAWVLTAGSLDANNGNDLLGTGWGPQATAPTGSLFYTGAPGAVRPVTSSFSVNAQPFTYTFPARSVVFLTFKRK